MRLPPCATGRTPEATAGTSTPQPGKERVDLARDGSHGQRFAAVEFALTGSWNIHNGHSGTASPTTADARRHWPRPTGRGASPEAPGEPRPAAGGILPGNSASRAESAGSLGEQLFEHGQVGRFRLAVTLPPGLGEVDEDGAPVLLTHGTLDQPLAFQPGNKP